MSTSKKRLGRPPLPSSQRGIQMGYRVFPATRDALLKIADKTGEAPSEALDRIILSEFSRLYHA